MMFSCGGLVKNNRMFKRVFYQHLSSKVLTPLLFESGAKVEYWNGAGLIILGQKKGQFFTIVRAAF